MTLLSYVKGLWTALLPAATKAKMENIEDGIKAASDVLDLETDAGRALTQAADAEAQRSALGLGDSATKNVGTTAGTVAAGNAPAGAVTTHESTYAHANLPTAAGKTAADAIGAATGATTALKLANLTSPASPTQQGVALLGASGGAPKLTIAPDGATPVYSKLTFPTTDGWASDYTPAPSVSDGILSWKGDIIRSIAGCAGKTLVMWVRCTSGYAKIRARYGTTGSYLGSSQFLTQNVWAKVILPLAAGNNNYVIINSPTTTATFETAWMFIGDYSYLEGSESESGIAAAVQIGDIEGNPEYAIGTITATGLATAGTGDSIGGKKYTFVAALTASPGVEGEVLKGATKEDDLENLNLALSETTRANNGIKYWATAVNPLVSSTKSSAVLYLTSRLPGMQGNKIPISCDIGTNHTASGANLVTGKDKVGAQLKNILKNDIAQPIVYNVSGYMPNFNKGLLSLTIPSGTFLNVFGKTVTLTAGDVSYSGFNEVAADLVYSFDSSSLSFVLHTASFDPDKVCLGTKPISVDASVMCFPFTVDYRTNFRNQLPVKDFSFTPPDFVTANDGSGDFNPTSQSAAGVYALYDALVTAYPNYISRVSLGNDSSGTIAMYAYIFSPENVSPTFSVLLTAGAHGNDTAGDNIEHVASLYYFVKSLCEKFTDNESLAFIRTCLKLIVVPMVNPWGIQNNSRGNYNGVDINRNFNYLWESAVGEYGFSKGASAADQVETQYIQSLFTTYLPKLHLDIHCIGRSDVPTYPFYFYAITGSLNEKIHRATSIWLKTKYGQATYVTASALSNWAGEICGYGYGVARALSSTIECFPILTGETLHNLVVSKANVDFVTTTITNLVSVFKL